MVPEEEESVWRKPKFCSSDGLALVEKEGTRYDINDRALTLVLTCSSGSNFHDKWIQSHMDKEEWIKA